MDDNFFIFPLVLALVSFTIFCGCCCLCLCFAKKHRGRFPRVNRSRPINASTNTEDTGHGFTHFPSIYTDRNNIGPPSYYEATAPSLDDCENNSNHHGVCHSSANDGGGTCDSSANDGGGTYDTGGGNDSGGGTCDSGGGGGCDSGGTD